VPSAGLGVRSPRLFLFSWTVSRGFAALSQPPPRPGVAWIRFSGQHREPAAAAGPQREAGDFWGTSHHCFSGISALAGGRPLGAHCHGNGVGMAAPNRRGLPPAVGFPTDRPRIAGVKRAGGREAQRRGRPGARSHPAGRKGAGTGRRGPEHRPLRPQLLTQSRPSPALGAPPSWSTDLSRV